MMLRSFVAIELPSQLQNAILKSTAPLWNTLPGHIVRWVAPKNIHLTLKFLGDVSPANLERLAEALKAEAAAHEAFTMSAGRLGAFPTVSRARVIWIGLDAPTALPALQRGVEAVSARMGYPPEERKFSPHLTIGRVNQSATAADLLKLRAALEATKVETLGTVTVDAVHIFKSDLQPGGSVYTRLYSLPLTH